MPRRLTWLLAAFAAVLQTASACQPDPVEPCATPPPGAVVQTLPAGASCTGSWECASEYCTPAGYCAGEPAAGDCSAIGTDWDVALVRACDEEACGRPLRSLCFEVPTTPSAGCDTSSDCAAGEACMRDTTGVGSCIQACADPATLIPVPGSPTPYPHLCAAETESCIAVSGTSGGYCVPDTVEVLDVALFGAECSDATPVDAGPAIAAALRSAYQDSTNSRSVCMHACTYFVDQTLAIGDDTTLYGQGADATTLQRGDTVTSSKQYLCPTEDEGDCTLASLPSKVVIINEGYNRGNRNITLRDFGIDGSLVEPEANGPSNIRPMVAIALSSVRNTHIERLHLQDVPQDGIFFRNGGYDCSVKDTVIDGFNRRYFNGAAINLEMQPNGIVAPQGAPLDDAHIANLEIRNNTIIARGPLTYCSGSPFENCDRDAECTSGTCSVSPQVDLINANVTLAYAPASGDWTGKYFPNPTIENNTLLTSASQVTAIECVSCEDTIVRKNCIAAFDTDLEADAATTACGDWIADLPGATGPELNGAVTFNAILISELKSGITSVAPPAENFTIENNNITGKGSGRGIHLVGNLAGSQDVTIAHNLLRGWTATWDPNNQAAIDILGYRDVSIVDNTIDGLCAPVDTGCIGNACLWSSCPANDIGAINVALCKSGVLVDDNTIQNKLTDSRFIHPTTGQLLNGAGGIVHIHGANDDSSAPDAWVMSNNTISCAREIGAYAVFSIGRVGPSSYATSHGLLDDNDVSLTGCNPAVGDTTLTNRCFGAVTDLEFLNNNFSADPTCASALPLQ